MDAYRRGARRMLTLKPPYKNLNPTRYSRHPKWPPVNTSRRLNQLTITPYICTQMQIDIGGDAQPIFNVGAPIPMTPEPSAAAGLAGDPSVNLVARLGYPGGWLLAAVPARLDPIRPCLPVRRSEMTKASRIHLWRHVMDHGQTTVVGQPIRELSAVVLRHFLEWIGIRGGVHAPRSHGVHDQHTNSNHRLTRRIEMLEAEIAYRQLLLEEVIHRTKNALQLAVVTLGEHIDEAGDAWTRHDLRSVQKQMRALSRTHNRFYGPVNGDGQSLNLRLSEICLSIFDSFGERSGRIALSLAIAEIRLQRHQEISVSVILQELLTNALKHAFPDRREGTITINFDVDDDSICHLVVQDDGVGRHLSNQASTGLALVKSFASGLQGCCLEVFAHHGTTMRVSFPLAAR
ncbi:Two-component sensor histidine kinase, contains HisKA and HATPase domains [Rhizobiales bacterium GAS191]|nr:Two-component sensor histidine kinase, contains HisKA and HATPase domains [Rhizobiales bacterium GAS191]